MQDSSALRVESGSADITKIWERQYPEGISWDMPIQTAPVQKILEDAVIRFGDKSAIDFQGLEMSYEQLGALVSKIAAGLQQNGVEKDVKVHWPARSALARHRAGCNSQPYRLLLECRNGM